MMKNNKQTDRNMKLQRKHQYFLLTDKRSRQSKWASLTAVSLTSANILTSKRSLSFSPLPLKSLSMCVSVQALGHSSGCMSKRLYAVRSSSLSSSQDTVCLKIILWLFCCRLHQMFCGTIKKADCIPSSMLHPTLYLYWNTEIPSTV